MQKTIGYPGIKILLIEDNLGDARLIKEHLKDAIDCEYIVHHAEDLSDGLKSLELDDYDVVLLDLTLPDSRGFETVIKTREKTKNIPIVILTGLKDDDLARKALQTGAQDYLIKGQIDGNPLARSIYHAIDRNKMTQTIESLAHTLQQNEERLRKIIDLNADAIIIVNGEGIVNFVNPAAEKLFSKKREDFIGEFFGFPTQIGETSEFEVIKNGGSTIFAEMNAVEIKWEQKKAFLLTIRNISERKEFEEKLKKSEGKYRGLFENSPFPILIIDLKGIVRDCNSSLAKLTGFEKNQLIEKHYLKIPFIEKEDDPELKKAYDSLLEKKVPRPIEFNIINKNGLPIFVNINFAFIEIEDETLVHLLFRDITQLKRSEQEVRKLGQALHEMNALIEHAPLAIVLSHQSGKILRINDEAKNLLGFEEEEMLNMSIYDLFEPSNMERIKRHYNKDIYDLRSTNNIETCLINRFNRVIDVEITSTILKIADAIIIQSFISDISERKTSEKNRQMLLDQLIASSEFKTQFLATMSHELRTPLNAILGFSQLLIEEAYGELNLEQKEFITDINVAGDHLLNLIDEVLDYSKMDAGKFRINYEHFPVCEVIEEVNGFIKPLYTKQGLEYEYKNKRRSEMIYADPLRFKQILINLLTNAIKFTEKGKIVLRIDEKDDKWLIMVKDTGCGIGEEDYDVVFREFGRVENDRIKDVSGAGIGLALTKRLVNLHGGEIWFESELDKGTSFYFTISKKINDGDIND